VVETEVTVGAVVSVVEVELSVLAVLLSSLLLQEKTVRLKIDMRIM
jgi:hypothetical protein